MGAHPFRTSPRSLGRAAFVSRYGGVYEHSAWAAERAFDAGMNSAADTAEGLAALLKAQVEGAGEAAQLALLCAHPDLAGKLKLADLTRESRSEQTGAGLDQCTAEELAEFTSLNDRYKAKFGFPFIFAVKGFHRTDILNAFRARVDHDRPTEFKTALAQVHRIAALRLVALAEQDNG